MSPKRRLLFVALIALSILVAVHVAQVLGMKAGAAAAVRSKERLQLVWPWFIDMPVDDRALLVGLAMTCHVEDQPAIAGDVVECLRNALDDPHVMLPKGIDRNSARARLRRLLRQRNV
ncbi:hypothetical protein A8H39_01790 [Paraburkholderia fungorum]|nr:hypothetical protein A8H39_01790 [Paraburkholderia fungorum]